MSSGFDAVQKYVIGGVDTDFVVHKFNEKLFVLITQFGKITNILTVSNERDFESDLFQKYNKHLNVQNKFGKDEDEVQAAVRRIFTQVECKGIQSYVVSLGIREINKDSLGEIVEVLKQILSS
ncbi:uncharacterized protein LOC129788653 isoform X2 [Lutzomyia longipalpis]|nr:uncharacterized protein LOC129788653 isoform X2 [Lutzomyia longipalpis]